VVLFVLELQSHQTIVAGLGVYSIAYRAVLNSILKQQSIQSLVFAHMPFLGSFDHLKDIKICSSTYIVSER
jgi:hypothetical protein